MSIPLVTSIVVNMRRMNVKAKESSTFSIGHIGSKAYLIIFQKVRELYI
jgi:hypothetical protein